MIIDAHIHLYPDGREPAKNRKSKEDLVRQIRRGGISRAVVLPLGPDVSNEFVRDICARYPDVFTGFATVDPADGEKTLGIIEQCVHEYRLRGLKLHPRFQKFSLKEPVLVPLLEKCAALRIPVIIDAFPGTEHGSRESSPFLIEKLALQVPSVNIIMAHAGGYRVLDALFAAKNCRNIYIDLSFAFQYFQGSSVTGDIVFLMKKLGAGRCIYGSDYPEMDMVKSLKFMNALLKRNRFTGTERELIMGGTIASLLNPS